jgi:hypothetical protein
LQNWPCIAKILSIVLLWIHRQFKVLVPKFKHFACPQTGFDFDHPQLLCLKVYFISKGQVLGKKYLWSLVQASNEDLCVE